ncbi:MAG: hypothetical protein JWN99_3168 [Ilumatobacteraceae bacterium]|nr:hypothetical protein [Ilumatobacteraceae bacterium]
MELLISVSLTGIVVASLGMATTVILRQTDNTRGRTSNARSEQAIGIYMPTDLSSAETVDTTPQAVPCGPAPACPAGTTLTGSNALMLTWTGSVFINNAVVATQTKVSYRVTQVGTEFQMVRVQCVSTGGATPVCDTRVILHKLDPPPAGVTWTPGTTPPSWIMTVSQAAAANDTSSASQAVTVDPGLKNKNAQRVVVTVNGGGDAAGGGGGQNQISLSAGGTNRENQLATDDLSGAPTFTAARSRCGGNYGVIIDKSGSIGSDMAAVVGGVQSFISEFAGTPVKLQVVTFSDTAQTLGASGSTWTKYYDMLVDTDVTALKNLVGGVTSGGSTNWEDGFFRMLKNSDGTVQANLPKTILFFTDGQPTRSRLDGTSASVAAVADPLDANLPGATNAFYQTGWNRAERLIRDRGNIDIVGVFVSSDTEGSSTWVTSGAGYKYVWERDNAVVYEKGTTYYERGSTVKYQKGTPQKANNVVFQYSTDAKLTFQQYTSGQWKSRTWAQYLAGNTTPDSSDNWRTVIAGALSTNASKWATISTQAQYDATNVNSGYADGFRTSLSTASATPYTTITAAQYNGSNTTTDATDGFQVTWANTTQAIYEPANTTADDTDFYKTIVTGTPSSWTWTGGFTQAQYDESNTTADDTDGWRTGVSWATTPQATYEASNSTADETDFYRTRVNGTLGTWTAVTQAQFDDSNLTGDETDGWRVTKTYAPTYTGYDPNTTKSIKNYATVGNLVVDNTSGVAGGYTPATRDNNNGTPTNYADDTGNYTNAAVADLFLLPDYAKFNDALSTIALGQCGGTVTIQTRIAGSAALDPFTYENGTTHEVVRTSGAYRSGTFDVALPGGSSTSVTISPQDFTNLTSYSPAGWTCKSGGNNYAFTSAVVPGHAPWTSITMNVSPNQAVSCIQNVTSP